MHPHRLLTLEQEEARIAAARDYYLSHGGTISELETYRFKPRPARSESVDPDTVLARKKPKLTRADRARIKQMADSI